MQLSWKAIKDSEKNKPRERYGQATLLHEDKIYFFGGYDTQIRYNDLHVFDIKKKTWDLVQTNSVKPSPRCGQLAFFFKDILYIFGGSDGNDLNDLWKLNLATRKWSQINYSNQEIVPPMCYHSGSLYNDKVYIFGGISKSDVVLDKFLCLDLNTFTFTQLPIKNTKLTPLFRHTSEIFNNNLYIYGGSNSSYKTVKSLYKVNLDNFECSLINTENAPQERCGHSSFVYNNYLYILNGLSDDIYFNDLNRLNLLNPVSWEFVVSGEQIYKPKFGQSIVLRDNTLYQFYGGVQEIGWNFSKEINKLTFKKSNSFLMDMEEFLKREELTNFEIECLDRSIIKAHKQFINLAIPPQFEKIFLQKCRVTPKNIILNLLNWIYCGGFLNKMFLEQFHLEFSQLKQFVSEIQECIQKNQSSTSMIQIPLDLSKFVKLLDSILSQEKTKQEKSNFAFLLDKETNQSYPFDFYIKVDQKRIPTHQFILAARSNLYRGMFISTQDDSCEAPDLSGRSFEAVELFVKFLYTNSIESSISNIDIAFQLIDAIEFYGLSQSSPFRKQLISYISKNLSKDLFLQYIQSLQFNAYPDLFEFFQSFIVENFGSFSRKEKNLLFQFFDEKEIKNSKKEKEKAKKQEKKAGKKK